MANIKSQKKRNITNAKRAARNKAVKSELKTRVKSATASLGTDRHDEDVRLTRPDRLCHQVVFQIRLVDDFAPGGTQAVDPALLEFVGDQYFHRESR